MAMTTITASELLTDRPVEWDVFDPDGTLLLAKGSILDAEAKKTLLKRGAVRAVDAEIGKLLETIEKPSPASSAAPQKSVRMLLSETAIQPGDTIYLDRNLDGSRITASLIGYLKGRSVIITVPADERGAIFLKEGESVFAKVFSGKHVVAFPSSVLAVVLKPFPHLHLNYPAEVTGIVVRRSERVGVRLIAAIETANEKAAGIVMDLSTGGLSFASRFASLKPGIGVLCNFKLTLSDSVYLMSLRAVVRTVYPGQPDVLDGAPRYGAQFMEMSAEDTLIIGLFVRQQLVAARAAAA
ncbi:flagellar brake protein [Sulfuricystis multivorans]|uniref:flagellar brake protein n=1 Tax=Sulfuricystis multivorans TaxID=2211108 RepID=UPI000F816079|nr:flagellar brake protein [Sulfuricystis multivorans]